MEAVRCLVVAREGLEAEASREAEGILLIRPPTEREQARGVKDPGSSPWPPPVLSQTGPPTCEFPQAGIEQ